MVASQAELEDASVPLQWRDYCAHLLIPLNACRRETLSAPWRCGHERHAYEQCQFNESDTAAAQRANTSTCTCTSISALTDTQSYLWRQEAQRQSRAAAAAEAQQQRKAPKK